MAAETIQNEANQTTQITPQAAANSQASNAPWYDAVQDTELKGWLTNKKYESPEMAAKAAWSLERLLGADKAGRTIVLPKDDADAEGLKAFRTKLGVPESADGYKLPLPEGQTDDSFAKVAAQWFHAAGAPPKTAELITQKFNEYITSEIARGKAEETQKAEGELTGLKQEWAHQFDERAELGRRGLRSLGKEAGLDDNDLKSLESSIGTAKMLKVFWKLGQAGQEGGFAGGSSTAQFGKTKDQAQEEFNALQAKRLNNEINEYAWNKEYANAGGRLDQLMKIITS